MKTQFEPTIVQNRDDAANDSSSLPRNGRLSAMLRRLVLLAVPAGAASRLRPEAAPRDNGRALYNRGGLLRHGQTLLTRCRQERRELTLAVFDCGDLLEARAIYGTSTSRALIDFIATKLTCLVGAHGLAARTGPAQFAVAMPMARDRAVLAIERVLGNPCRIELERGNSEIVLVPNLMVEAVPDGTTLEQLFAAQCRGLARIQEEESSRLRYLQRERERHSRPMSDRRVRADTAGTSPVRSPRAEPESLLVLPSTMPMALTVRQHSGA